MKKQQKDLLLLGLVLLQLKEIYKIKADDVLENYDSEKILSLWEINFPDKNPSIEQLKSLAIESHRDLLKVKNTKYKKIT